MCGRAWRAGLVWAAMRRDGATRIVDCRFTPFQAGLTEPFAIAGGAPATADNVRVEVALEDGTVGLGEAAPLTAVSGETQASTLRALQTINIVGQDVQQWRRVCGDVAQALAEAPAAAGALEIGIVDAFARQKRMSLWSMLGGAEVALETDMTIPSGDLEHATRSAKAIAARRISTLKIKVGALSASEDAARVVAASQAYPEARIFVDANGGYSVDEALRFVTLMQTHGVHLEAFEQPVHRDDLVALAHALPSPRPLIVADESCRSPADVIHLAQAGAIDGINIKLMKTGILRSLELWSLASALGLDLMMGAMVESRLGISTAVHFAAGLGGFRLCDLDTHWFMKDDPFEAGFEEDGGTLRVKAEGMGSGAYLRSSRSSS